MAIVTHQEPAMVGRDKGLSTRLQDDFAYVFAFHDLSHIYHLICKSAVQTYKQETYKMIKYISAHFTRSPLRVATFERIQKDKGRLTPLNVFSFTKNRWLSLTESLERLMKIWEDLKSYFTEIKDKEGLKYLTEENYCYAQCLFILLTQLAHYNKEFQKNEMNYNDVLTTMKESFIVFAREVLPKRYEGSSFEELYKISFETKDLGKSPVLDFGAFKNDFTKNYIDVLNSSSKLSSEKQKALFEDVRSFIFKVLTEMKDRLPLENKIFKETQVVFLRNGI